MAEDDDVQGGSGRRVGAQEQQQQQHQHQHLQHGRGHEQGRFGGGIRGSITLPPLASTVFPSVGQPNILPSSHQLDLSSSSTSSSSSPLHPLSSTSSNAATLATMQILNQRQQWPPTPSASSSSQQARYPSSWALADPHFTLQSPPFAANTHPMYDTRYLPSTSQHTSPSHPQLTDPSRRLPPLDYITNPGTATFREPVTSMPNLAAYGYNTPLLETRTTTAASTGTFYHPSPASSHPTSTPPQPPHQQPPPQPPAHQHHHFSESVAEDPEWEWGLQPVHTRSLSFEQQLSQVTGGSTAPSSNSSPALPQQQQHHHAHMSMPPPSAASTSTASELAAMSNVGASSSQPSSLRMRATRSKVRPGSSSPIQSKMRRLDPTRAAAHRRTASGSAFVDVGAPPEFGSSRRGARGQQQHPHGTAGSGSLSTSTNTAGILFRARSYPTRLMDSSAPELEAARSTRPQETTLDSNLEPDRTVVKKKRKRADVNQLRILNETYARTAFPSTEERADLARRLEMSCRSVQIWFQNKRQASRQNRLNQANAESSARGGGSPTLQLGPAPGLGHAPTQSTLASTSLNLVPAPLNLGSASLPLSIAPLPEPPNSASSSHFSGSGTEYSPYSPDFGHRTQVFALPLDPGGATSSSGGGAGQQEYGTSHFRPSPPSYGRPSGSGGDYARGYGHTRSTTTQSLDSMIGGGLGGAAGGGGSAGGGGGGVTGGIRMALPSAGTAPLNVGSAPVRSHMPSQYPAQGFSEGVGPGVGGAPRGGVYFPGRSSSAASVTVVGPGASSPAGGGGYRSADEYSVTGSRGAATAEYTTADFYHGTTGTIGRDYQTHQHQGGQQQQHQGGQQQQHQGGQQQQHQRDYSGSSNSGRAISPLPRSPSAAYRPTSPRPTSHRRAGSPPPLPRINSPPPPAPAPVPRLRRRGEEPADAPPPATKKRRDRGAGS